MKKLKLVLIFSLFLFSTFKASAGICWTAFINGNGYVGSIGNIYVDYLVCCPGDCNVSTSANIHLYKDGVYNSTIATNIPYSSLRYSNGYNWQIPCNQVVGDYEIRIIDYSTGYTTTRAFTIYALPTPIISMACNQKLYSLGVTSTTCQTCLKNTKINVNTGSAYTYDWTYSGCGNCVLSWHTNGLPVTSLDGGTYSVKIKNGACSSLASNNVTVLTGRTCGSREGEIEEEISSISVSPNPASNIMEIAIPFMQSASYSIIDKDGKAVASEEILTQKSEINISDVQSGLYLLRLSFDGKTENRKIVVIK